MRTLAHTLWTPKDLPDEALALLFDAEKAFHRIDRGYLFATMTRFGLGDQFIAKVRLLYDGPSAQVNCSGFLLDASRLVGEHARDVRSHPYYTY